MPIGDEPGVPTSRFDKGGHWSDPPVAWSDEVDERLLAEKLSGPIREAIDALPEAQRQVVMMRDVGGLSSSEVCEILGITEGNQRVLLHRGRSRVRMNVEQMIGQA